MNAVDGFETFIAQGRVGVGDPTVVDRTPVRIEVYADDGCFEVYWVGQRFAVVRLWP